MHNFLVNLMIGIVGGIYSSVIVSRVFLIREKLEDQLEVLKEKCYYFGTLTALFDVIETILKLANDTSDDIEREIQQNPKYLKTHNIIDADNLIMSLKKELLDKTIDEICDEEKPLVLKEKAFIELLQETKETVKKIKEISPYKFSEIDESRKQIDELEEKYRACVRSRGRYFLGLIVKDITIIVLVALLMVLCVLLFFV